MDIMDRYNSLSADQNFTGNEIQLTGAGHIITCILEPYFTICASGRPVAFQEVIPETIIGNIESVFKLKYVKREDEYVITAGDTINVYANNIRGMIYAAHSLIRHKLNGDLGKGYVYNYPACEFRCIKLFTPSRHHKGFFREYVDLCCYYGYNTIMMEIGGAMEYKRHPEINQGWEEYCKKLSGYQGQTLDCQNQADWARNSIHIENGGGSFLSQAEVRELIDYCEARGLEVIPEVPSLSHSDYLLTGHPELRERENDDLPDTYCPSKPETYELLFDVLEEVIQVFRPKRINIGHDEYYSIGLCSACKKRNADEIYADDITKIYGFLKQKGIRTMIWGDKLLNAILKKGLTVGGARRIVVNDRTGMFLEEIPATYHAIDKIPKDIEIMHWYWGILSKSETEFLSRNFYTVLGNFEGMGMRDWEERITGGISGICVSNWGMLDAAHVQRSTKLFNVVYTAYMIWGNSFQEDNYQENLRICAKSLYQYRVRDYKAYIEIVHRTSCYKEHFYFADGYMIDKDDDYLGKYEVKLSNGSSMEIPLYYNLNIGTEKVDILRKDAQDSDSLIYDKQLLESSYTCDFEFTDRGIFYRFAISIPDDCHITAVSIINDSKYGDSIQLKEIETKRR